MSSGISQELLIRYGLKEPLNNLSDQTKNVIHSLEMDKLKLIDSSVPNIKFSSVAASEASVIDEVIHSIASGLNAIEQTALVLVSKPGVKNAPSIDISREDTVDCLGVSPIVEGEEASLCDS
ncbi:hypothetical protein [Candidatus Phycorickettsia trachydisci]|nr:hypothetical protein [Candidatus Phycorickettsia trachydisci]